jgi:hypothetical protein
MKEVGEGVAKEPLSGWATGGKGEWAHLVPVPVIHWPSPYPWRPGKIPNLSLHPLG